MPLMQENRNDIFGKGIPQLVHDIRNPLNIIIGFSSIIQIDETVNDEIRTYLKKIFQSGMAIEQLLSNIDFFMMDRDDLEETSLDVVAETSNFLKLKSDVISEKQIFIEFNKDEKILIKFSLDIFTRILENLFLFSFKAFRTLKTKEIRLFYKIVKNDFYIIYTDSSENIYLNGKYFTFNEVLEAKRGLGPKFIERFVDIYNGEIFYLNNKELVKKLRELDLFFDVKNYAGFILKIPFST